MSLLQGRSSHVGVAWQAQRHLVKGMLPFNGDETYVAVDIAPKCTERRFCRSDSPFIESGKSSSPSWRSTGYGTVQPSYPTGDYSIRPRELICRTSYPADKLWPTTLCGWILNRCLNTVMASVPDHTACWRPERIAEAITSVPNVSPRG